MDEIIRIQQAFTRKAMAQPTYRFRELYSLVWKPTFLNQALDWVLANKGSRSAGLDGVTKTDFQDPRESIIRNVVRSVRSKPRRSGGRAAR